MNKVLEYFKNNQLNKIIVKDIKVYGWQYEYDHLLISSICNYLFEDLKIIENIVDINDDNRPGVIKPNKYITIHDTGDVSSLHTAKFWSNTVYSHSFEQKPGDVIPYPCSYQYVVDDKEIYHNVPDNEVAYHAGDGTKFDYTLYDSGIEGSNPYPIVTISNDGYYMIDNKKTIILAPRYHYVKNNEVIEDKIAISSDINDLGVLCKLIDGKYYIGETYFSNGYKKIANRGGNNNSIGIESCITEGDDLYHTWQKTAKLVAYLMDKEHLTLDDVVQHHYFSGKNCPQTMRMNEMWHHVKELIKFEYDILMFKKDGYKIELICDDNRVNNIGRIIDIKTKEKIEYIIRTTKDEKIEEIKLEVNF